jgi:large subunit ribosomal protein L15
MSMIHTITSQAPRYKKRLRKGRGEGSGHGKTSGRGTKGSGARQGKPIKHGHEGGQTPIYRRLPKRGFSNAPFAIQFQVVNVGDLERFADGATVDASAMREAGLIGSSDGPVKILGDGPLTRRLTVQATWYSKSAHAKIVAAGGAAQNAKGEPFEFPKPKKVFVPRPPAKKGGKPEAAEAAKTEAPKTEAPKAQTPKPDAPPAEAPKPEAATT